MHKEGMHEGHKMAKGEKCEACAKGECTGEECKAKHGAEAAMTCKDGSCETAGHAHAAAALEPQKTCPVMGGKINKAVYADVNGKRVYACCPGCISKIKAEPEKYMAVLAERGEAVETLPVAKLNTETLATLKRVGVKMTLVDARGSIETVIPGAAHLPSKAPANKLAATLPDKDALIVTYCASLQCPASANLAGRLRELGYTNVVEYPYGIEGWTAAGLKTEPAPAD
jgi:rhodanese-related sulfurtransferase